MRSGQHLTGNPRRLGIKTMIGTLQRSRKKSFYWYQKVIQTNGEDLA